MRVATNSIENRQKMFLNLIMITAVFSCLRNLSECFLGVAHVQKGKTRTSEAGSCDHFISNGLKACITLYLSCKCLAKSI